MAEKKSVTKMWSALNPSIFERGSFTMLFKKLELLSVAHTVADLVMPNNGAIENLYLIGCATANREIRVIKQANQSLVNKICMKNVQAIDIAPQLLAVADKRLSLLKLFGLVKNYTTQQLSAEQIKFTKNKMNSLAILGIYDLNGLLKEGSEKNDEPLGLDEYSGPMRDVLGELTQISSLQYLNSEFKEKELIADYDSSAPNHNNNKIREKLRNYHSSNTDICAMRIAIKHKSNPDSPVFVSTWFNLVMMKSIFQELGLDCQINSLDSDKGAVLVVTKKGFRKDYGASNIALALNNVFGNLANDRILTNFARKLVTFCNN